jgi:Putative DNA-binding domain
MLPKNVSDVSLADVQTLCDNHVLESRLLDFKAEAIGRGDRDKRDFLADVCAFANASGGDLILGVQTKDGAADKICGIDVPNPDEEKQFLVNVVRDGLEPRISGLDTKWLSMEGKRGVMVVRVHRSWSVPHRVTFLKDMKFYVRNPAGKHPMSVDELRQAFNFSATVAERMRAFRDERVQIIGAQPGAQQLPFDVQSGPKIAVLIVPLSAMVDPLDLPVKKGQTGIVRPILEIACAYEYYFEGMAAITRDKPPSAYALMFRTGAVEFVTPIGEPPARPNVSPYKIERAVFVAWNQFIDFAKSFGVDPPIWLFATLIDVGGLMLSTAAYGPHIRRNIVPLPEVFIGPDDLGKRPEVLFKRVLDVAANAFGLPELPS